MQRLEWYLFLAYIFIFSLQFDPSPRAGEPSVTRRTPDYFLVGSNTVYLFIILLRLLTSLVVNFL